MSMVSVHCMSVWNYQKSKNVNEKDFLITFLLPQNGKNVNKIFLVCYKHFIFRKKVDLGTEKVISENCS